MPIPNMLNLASIANSDSPRLTSLPLRPKGLFNRRLETYYVTYGILVSIY